MSFTRVINFQENWNKKLDNKIFTTIRKVGIPISEQSICEIHLKNKLYKWATVISCKKVFFHEIPLGILITDTGYSDDQALKLFQSFGIDINNSSQEVLLYYLESSPRMVSLSDINKSSKHGQQFLL